MHLIIFDIDKDKIVRLRTALEAIVVVGDLQLSFVHASFEELLSLKVLDATVSPSNSMLFFDGGVDKAYQATFPNIQARAQTLMRSFGVCTTLDRPFLPVGSGLVVHTLLSRCPYLIATPTMFFPEDIRGTENVRHAVWVALKMSRGLGAETVGIPCMGMGYGKLTAEECASEFARGFEMKTDLLHNDLISFREGAWYVRKNMACRQPDTYCNTECQDLRNAASNIFPITQ
jgi:O-acetyl-ADP-ribose deacetylase (regulator of RNase III)